MPVIGILKSVHGIRMNGLMSQPPSYLGGACFGFYLYGLIIFQWKNLANESRKFIINHILVLNTSFSRSDLLEFLENIQIIKLFKLKVGRFWYVVNEKNRDLHLVYMVLGGAAGSYSFFRLKISSADRPNHNSCSGGDSKH